MKRALQGLLIAGEKMMDDVFSRKKKITIREGHRDYTKGPLLIGCIILNWVVMRTIIRVDLCSLKDISLDDIKRDGFIDHNDALNGLRKFYPDMTLDSDVTVVEWE